MSIQVGQYAMQQAEALDPQDSRGVVWIWEPPRANATYVVACDPSYGLPGWDRLARQENDQDTDNCAIQVIRVGSPDVQVAEYAAPIDAEDAAYMVNFLGRMYAGNHEDGQALAIVEVHPGPGLLTQRELINRFGYTNLFIWQHLDAVVVKPTLSYGWYSSRQSRQMLWIRGVRHITQKKVTINSPWLVEEMTDLSTDSFLSFTSRAQWGCHDDRCVAFLLGLWAAHQWTVDNPAPEEAKPMDMNQPDYQRSDMTAEEMAESWDESVGERFFSKF